MKKWIVAASILSVVCFNGVDALAEEQEVIRVSVVNLIANPKDYDGKRVLVGGFYVLETEESVLYLSREAAEFGIFALGIWIDFEESGLDPSQFNGKIVSLIGVVDGNRSGSFDLNPAAIRSLKKVRVMDRRRFGESNRSATPK